MADRRSAIANSLSPTCSSEIIPGGPAAPRSIAPLPERLQNRSLAATGLLAHILFRKYCDQLPLYRQEQIYQRRHQMQLPRLTLSRWVELDADWLRPDYESIVTGDFSGGYVQTTRTTAILRRCGI